MSGEGASLSNAASESARLPGADAGAGSGPLSRSGDITVADLTLAQLFDLIDMRIAAKVHQARIGARRTG